MKRLSKNRVLSLFLALVMLFSALPFNTVGANASTSIGDINPNYGSVIGNTAQFNIEDSINFLIHNDPENFDYDTESGDWANEEYWIWYYAEESQIDFPENLELVITNYYWDSDSTALWYKVEAALGKPYRKNWSSILGYTKTIQRIMRILSCLSFTLICSTSQAAAKTMFLMQKEIGFLQ